MSSSISYMYSQQLSLDAAIDLDNISKLRKDHGKSTPYDSFIPSMYMQPSLARKLPVAPEAYRRHRRRTEGESVGVRSSVCSDDDVESGGRMSGQSVETDVAEAEEQLQEVIDLDDHETNPETDSADRYDATTPRMSSFSVRHVINTNLFCRLSHELTC